jgi:hypothetical protein
MAGTADQLPEKQYVDLIQQHGLDLHWEDNGWTVVERPKVESGTINPPEAPTTAPASPEEVPPVPPTGLGQAIIPAGPEDGLDALDRDALKGLAIKFGLVDSSSRIREEGLRDMLRQGGYRVDSPAPVQNQKTPDDVAAQLDPELTSLIRSVVKEEVASYFEVLVEYLRG